MGILNNRHFYRFFSLSILASTLFACGRELPPSFGGAPNPYQTQRYNPYAVRQVPSNFNQYPNPIGVFNSQGPQRFSSFASGGSAIKLHFVNAYLSSIEENERISMADPNGPAQAMIRWVDGARRSLDGSFYDINDENVVAAFIRTQKRGVRVRIVTDSDNMTEKGAGPGGPPRQAIVQMQKAGIQIVEDNRSAIMHNKFLIIDQTVVWTGSTNLTTSSLYHHNNNAVSVQSREIVANYQSEFDRMFVNRTFGPNPPHEVPYRVARVGNATVATYFSPKDGGKEAVVAEIQNARKNISFMTFSLTDQTIGSILIQKEKAGLQVQGVFDTWLGAGQYSLFNPLKQSGLKVSKDGNQALLHHKVILVDDVVITGSYNYSDNAENSNNENFLIIKKDTNVTRGFQQEFSRILNASLHNRRIPFQPKEEEANESKSQ